MKFTIANHMIGESIIVPRKTQDRAINILGSKEEFLKKVKAVLAGKIKAKSTEQFGLERDFISEFAKNVIETPSDSLFSTQFTLIGYFYLAEADEAEIGEVIHPQLLCESVDIDNPLLSISPSNYKFKAVFDLKLLELVQIANQSEAVKYFVRVE